MKDGLFNGTQGKTKTTAMMKELRNEVVFLSALILFLPPQVQLNSPNFQASFQIFCAFWYRVRRMLSAGSDMQLIPSSSRKQLEVKS